MANGRMMSALGKGIEAMPFQTSAANPKSPLSHGAKGTALLSPINSLAEGTDEVTESGPYILHKGEAVLNKDDAEKHRVAKRSKSTLGGKKNPKLSAKKGSKKKAHKTTVRKASNGGIVLEHHFSDGNSEMEQHPDFNSAADSMRGHYDEEPPAGGDEGQGGGMASPSSFENGGVVKKSGMAKVHKGEIVLPAANMTADQGEGKPMPPLSSLKLSQPASTKTSPSIDRKPPAVKPPTNPIK